MCVGMNVFDVSTFSQFRMNCFLVVAAATLLLQNYWPLCGIPKSINAGCSNLSLGFIKRNSAVNWTYCFCCQYHAPAGYLRVPVWKSEKLWNCKIKVKLIPMKTLSTRRRFCMTLLSIIFFNKTLLIHCTNEYEYLRGFRPLRGAGQEKANVFMLRHSETVAAFEYVLMCMYSCLNSISMTTWQP